MEKMKKNLKNLLRKKGLWFGVLFISIAYVLLFGFSPNACGEREKNLILPEDLQNVEIRFPKDYLELVEYENSIPKSRCVSFYKQAKGFLLKKYSFPNDFDYKSDYEEYSKYYIKGAALTSCTKFVCADGAYNDKLQLLLQDENGNKYITFNDRVFAVKNDNGPFFPALIYNNDELVGKFDPRDYFENLPEYWWLK